MTIRFHSKPHPYAALPAEGSASPISNETLLGIYTSMLKCRMLSERIGTLAKVGKKRAFASGSEAVAAAALADAQPDDSLISPALHCRAALLKGVPLATLLRPFIGRSSTAGLGGDAGHTHIAAGVLSMPLAGAVSCNLAVAALAAGCAFAARHGKCEKVAIAFYEGDNEEESCRDMFHFAVAHHLPVILIRQCARPLRPALTRRRRGKSVPKSLPIIPVDANDAVAVYRVAHEAIAHARRGSGPTLIDCVPLRVAGEHKQDSDCIARMERYLQAKDLRPDRIGAGVTQKFTRALDAAVDAARRNARENPKTRRSGMVR